MKTARLRVRSVRMKNGGAQVRVLHSDAAASLRERFLESADRCAQARSDLCGYAVVVWNRLGATTCDFGSMGAPIPAVFVPSFAHAVLTDCVLANINQTDESK